MEPHEKELRLTTLELSIEEIDRIIEGLQKTQAPLKQINEFQVKRWEIMKEINQVKKS